MIYEFDFSSVVAEWPQFLEGAWITIQLSFPATLAGLCLGILCAIGRRSPRRWLSKACGAYVEIIRNTPLLVQIFLVFFGLASLGWKVSAFGAALVSLIINVAAYTCEIVRAGMDSINEGQIEAAECLGLSKAQVYWHVVLWPAMEKVYPALTSQFVLLMLASSIASQISVEELTAIASRVQADTFRPFEAYILVAVAYLALSLLMRIALWAFGQMVFARRRKLAR
ncbi:amino acid ABC transporter permease [Parapusillimonas granuli]|uniref:Amino acid ABC transporter permease n=1 Tax=Parapusillimonas granuli TaxID=380911 RepID=A0A853FSW3_9BURK|nr:amino acid ABC transporter permease [Parapusillimonas granuli]MBB5214637.1 polar amino acid transport system permease protein [Parapusillimonas granuli]MEB2398115.1 amino acid ABC transporter permease [Alcaligenaceae bacterium]NYT48955.1 amino acid ABC transporter permease [Parapusillimonas granuli]